MLVSKILLLSQCDFYFPSDTFLCNFTIDNSKSIFNNQFINFKSGIEKLSKIVDSNIMTAKCQGRTTDHTFFKEINL